MTLLLSRMMKATLQTRFPIKSTASARFLHRFADAKPVGSMTKVVCTLGPSTDTKKMIGKRKLLSPCTYDITTLYFIIY